MSKKIVFATSTEATKRAESQALTDDELNVVAGGIRRNIDNPFVKAVFDAFYANGGTSNPYLTCPPGSIVV